MHTDLEVREDKAIVGVTQAAWTEAKEEVARAIEVSAVVQGVVAGEEEEGVSTITSGAARGVTTVAVKVAVTTMALLRRTCMRATK